MKASIELQNNTIVLENSYIRMCLDIEKRFRIESFTDLKNNINYGSQKDYLISFDRKVFNLAEKNSLNSVSVEISDINDLDQNSGKRALVILTLPFGSGNLTVKKHIFIYDNAGAVRIYDIFSTDFPVAGIYHSDLLNFECVPELEKRCVDFYTCTDQSNYRLIEKGAERKNKGNFFIMSSQKGGLFFYKEGPTPDAQPIKGEYDFISEGGKLSVAGCGFDKIRPGENRRANGVVLGLLEDSESLTGIKRYQRERYKMDCSTDVEVISNSWPAFHLNINEEKILREIEAASRCGVETVFIDDGWFEMFMGDINEEKFPSKFEKLSELATEKGVKIGLWMNPLGLDIKHPQAKVWDGAECHDTMVEGNSWNWIARTHNYIPVETRVSEEIRGYHAMDLCNKGFYNYIKEKVLNMYREYNITRYKFDLYQLNVFDTLLGDQNIHFEKYRELLSDLKSEIPGLVISMDVTRMNRPCFDFGQDFGRLFLENRGRGNKDHRYYHPYISLRNLWYTAKYFHPRKLELEYMPQIDDYPIEYVLSTAAFATSLYWGALADMPEEKLEKMKSFYQVFKPHRRAIMEGLITVFGEMPEKGNWSGFLSLDSRYPEVTGGYLIVYKNGAPENSADFNISPLKGKKLKCENIFHPGEVLTLNGNSPEFEIKEEFGFRLYKISEARQG